MFGNHLLDVIFSPWAAYTLYCANRLGIFKHLSAKSLTVEDLAAKTAAVPRHACAAMRLLHQNNRYYSNSYLANIYLVPGNPFYLGDIIEVMASESGKFEGLVDLVKGNNIEKKDIKREVSPHRFTMAMNNLAMLGEANALVNSLDLAQLLDDPGRKNLSVSLVSEWLKQTGFKSVRTFFLTEKSTCFTAQK